MSSNKVIWSIKEITEILRQRQLNKFDVNMGVSGKRGNGKSTLIFKIFNSFKKDGFKQRKHQVYARKEVIKLLANQTFSFCWDDEAINSGYKRDFQNSGQKDLIKIITSYRDNYNVYASALPFFYSLDKALRELIFIHIHIVERGLAVILLPLSDQIHSQDPWDTANNIKIEQKEYQRMKKDPKAKFRYQRLSTFAGYLYFGPMTKKQELKYKAIKEAKRKRSFEDAGVLTDEDKETSFVEKLYSILMDGKLTKEGLMQACLVEGEKFSNMQSRLNKILKDKGEIKTLKDFLLDSHDTINNKSKDMINNLVPSFSE